MTPASLRLGLMATFAALTLVGGGLCLAALNGGGEVRLGPWTLVRLAAGYARPAERLLQATVPPAEDQARAAALSRAALDEFPYDVSSWLRLAYVDRLRNGRLSPQGVAYLKTSYDLAAVDIYAGVWRIGFVLENSQDIPRDVRLAARKEFEALWGAHRYRDDLTQMAGSVQNPAGRLSAALWLNRAKSTAAK